MMPFKVIVKCWQDAKNYEGTECYFYFEGSDWNDYDYLITCCLHAIKKLIGQKVNHTQI